MIGIGPLCLPATSCLTSSVLRFFFIYWLFLLNATIMRITRDILELLEVKRLQSTVLYDEQTSSETEPDYDDFAFGESDVQQDEDDNRGRYRPLIPFLPCLSPQPTPPRPCSAPIYTSRFSPQPNTSTRPPMKKFPTFKFLPVLSPPPPPPSPSPLSKDSNPWDSYPSSPTDVEGELSSTPSNTPPGSISSSPPSSRLTLRSSGTGKCAPESSSPNAPTLAMISSSIRTA
jgi:hypothetical protein